MIGLVLALLASFSFSISNIFIRKGVYRSGESFSPLPISLFLGMTLFGLVLLFSGQFVWLGSISWLGGSALVGAGLIHFIFGRFLGYTGIRLIGANRTIPIENSYIPIAAILGISLFGEPMTITLVLALLLVVVGVILVGTAKSKMAKSDIPKGTLVKGVFAALGAALCWGVSPILVKIGLREVSSPFVATFISYTAAATVIGILLIYSGNNEKLRRLERASLISFIIAGFGSALAQLLRYTALFYSPVSLVAPLIASAKVLFLFPLSFIINRRIEAFAPRILAGATLVLVGVLLIFLAA